MSNPNVLDAIRLSSALLISRDWRPLHFALQPFHHLIRLTHILAMAGFYGVIGMLDLRLMGWNPTVPLRPLIGQARFLLYGLFTASIATGLASFSTNRWKVGSHAYFVPKLILIGLGVANAGLFHGCAFRAALNADEMPRHARFAGGISLALWTAVIVCACLNTEAAPRSCCGDGELHRLNGLRPASTPSTSRSRGNDRPRSSEVTSQGLLRQRVPSP